MTIREQFGLAAVSNIMLPDMRYSEHSVYKLANPDLIVGIECEIENWPTHLEYRHIGFHFETDGSLRNNGMEAITMPTKSKFVPTLLEGLYKHFNITDENYSHRCSTHVHVNCQDMTVEQVKLFALLYQVLERPLFGFIGHDRQDNIFCVPWSQCNMSVDFAHKFMYDPNFTIRGWQKYTALNLLPLRDRGTVEFRHLEGTCDIARITAWLNIIGMMHKYACTHNYNEFKDTILNMNSISNYGAFIEEVLGEHCVHLISQPSYQEDISLGVVDCKLCMINEKEDTQPKKKLATRDDEALNAWMMNELLAARNRVVPPRPPNHAAQIAQAVNVTQPVEFVDFLEEEAQYQANPDEPEPF